MIREGGAIFKRDMQKFLSNPFVVVMSLLMPLMYMVVFGNAVGGTLTGVPLGVVQGGLPSVDTPLFLSSVPLLGQRHSGKWGLPGFRCDRVRKRGHRETGPRPRKNQGAGGLPLGDR